MIFGRRMGAGKRGQFLLLRLGLLRLVLALAFVPFILTGLDVAPGLVASALHPGGLSVAALLRPLLPVSLAFLVLSACALISLRLWNGRRRQAGFLLAACACAAVWALAALAAYRVPGPAP